MTLKTECQDAARVLRDHDFVSDPGWRPLDAIAALLDRIGQMAEGRVSDEAVERAIDAAWPNVWPLSKSETRRAIRAALESVIAPKSEQP